MDIHTVWFQTCSMSRPKAPIDTMQVIGRRLAAARAALGLDQAALANAIGSTGTALGNWERGERLPNALAMSRLEQRFGVPMGWVYHGDPKGLPFVIAQKLLPDWRSSEFDIAETDTSKENDPSSSA